MDKPQAYKVLGIEPGSNERDVRRAYRALLFDLEDNGQSDPAYPEKKQTLEQAFEVCLKEAQTKKSKDTTMAEAASVEPVSVKRKQILRVGILVVITLLVVWGYTAFSRGMVDPRGESNVKTTGMIVALETVDNGAKIVAFNADGTKIESPSYAPGVIDRDIAWRNDGNRILFVSNRDKGNFNVFRWNPTEKTVDLRSTTGRPKSNLWYGWDDRPTMRDFGLLTAGGFVFQYDQKLGKTTQLLPPVTKRAQGQSGDDEGSMGQLDAIYKQIGDAFISAKWGAARKVIWSVMRREGGEVFVFNPMDEAVGKVPVPILAGKKIEFDVTPRGDAIVVVRHFEFVDPAHVPPDMLKNGKPVVPFDSVAFLVPANGSMPIPICQSHGLNAYGRNLRDPNPKDQLLAQLKKGEFTFAEPTVSPDGTMVALVVAAAKGETGFEGQSIVLFPIDPSAKVDPIPVVAGPVSQPGWGPKSDQLVYLLTNPDLTRSIMVADFATRTTRRITTEGDFSSPSFSPQKD